MKVLLLLLPVFFAVNSFAQEDTTTSRWANHITIESQIKTDRNGKGNSTFSYLLPKITTIIKGKTTLKGLESQFNDWNSYASDNMLGYEFNDKTREHDLPNFQVNYKTTIKSRFYAITAEVKGKLESRINKLTVTTTLNGMELAKFKKSLQDNGYLINENLTSIFRKETWQKDNQPTITVKKNANGTTSIGIF